MVIKLDVAVVVRLQDPKTEQPARLLNIADAVKQLIVVDDGSQSDRGVIFQAIETELPRHLSVDEVRGMKQPNFVCIDAGSHQLLTILPTKQKHDIEYFFYQLTPAARYQVKSIIMDMNMGYYHVFRRLFPKAEIIFDRFHLVHALNRTINH